MKGKEVDQEDHKAILENTLRPELRECFYSPEACQCLVYFSYLF